MTTMARFIMDPDHPSYSDDALDETNAEEPREEPEMPKHAKYRWLVKYARPS